jgi:apolipoprotein N-acyltransferase
MGLPPFSPLICYEVIFPGDLTPKKYRPQWLLNLTNDGWYGRTSGPYQHFEISRMRAIEEGLPLVRVANNGISAVIDPYGRIVAHLDLDEKGVLDTRLPTELGHPTLYSLWKDRIFWLVMLLLTGLSFVSSRYRHLFAF